VKTAHPAWPAVRRYLVKSGRALGVDVIDRCNLTVLLEPGHEDTAAFLADQVGKWRRQQPGAGVQRIAGASAQGIGAPRPRPCELAPSPLLTAANPLPVVATWFLAG
jgi:hypothetical protein